MAMVTIHITDTHAFRSGLPGPNKNARVYMINAQLISWPKALGLAIVEKMRW